MPRPFKQRQVGVEPGITYFKPRGIPLCDLAEVVLTVDEFEAVRLADFEGLYHEDGAQKMNIARQTFSKILIQAHEKIADALVNGKAIKIEGGEYLLRDSDAKEFSRPCRRRNRAGHKRE